MMMVMSDDDISDGGNYDGGNDSDDVGDDSDDGRCLSQVKVAMTTT